VELGEDVFADEPGKMKQTRIKGINEWRPVNLCALVFWHFIRKGVKPVLRRGSPS
jgi:hypothetical protein